MPFHMYIFRLPLPLPHPATTRWWEKSERVPKSKPLTVNFKDQLNLARKNILCTAKKLQDWRSWRCWPQHNEHFQTFPNNSSNLIYFHYMYYKSYSCEMFWLQFPLLTYKRICKTYALMYVPVSCLLVLERRSALRPKRGRPLSSVGPTP